MTFSFRRAVVFFMLGLPVGFILAALLFAVSGQPIIARDIFPWASGVALVSGLAGGFFTPAS